jgi:nicotinamide-nucleotide amidase
MKAAIITVGDEILIGQIVDTNSAWIAQRLNELGIELTEIRSISDTSEAITESLDDLLPQSDVILMTGGLGPTSDDRTMQTLADYYQDELVLHEPTLRHIEELFEKRGRKLIEANILQAHVPSLCTPIHNRYGTAPGMLFDIDDKIVVSMPGVPYEMQSMMEETVLPALEGRSSGYIKHLTITTFDIPESLLSEKLKDIEKELPEELSLAYLPNYFLVRLRLSFRSNQPHTGQLDRWMDRIREIVPEENRLEGDLNHAAILIEILKQRQKTVATAESCSGGKIAHEITKIPGCSSVYLGSTVTYQNDQKHNILGVHNKHFTTVGAVSEEVVKEMASGIRKLTGADYSVSISGIAGPGGATSEKPVGTVWVGIEGPNGTKTKKLQLTGNREKIIERTAIVAITMLRRFIVGPD